MKIRLKDITTRTELAAALNVDIKAIGLITLSSTTCRNKNCNLPAALHNNTYCIVHSQTWFPRTTTAKGKKSKNSRGHGLYGRKYMSVYNGVEQKKTCCCENDLCNKIGYSHEGMFHPPYHEKDCKEALWVLGITSKEARDEIAANPNNYHIAPWHYHNYHRKMGDDGKWVLRESIAPDGKYRDNEKKPFGYPPPNASVQNYINAEESFARATCLQTSIYHSFRRGTLRKSHPLLLRRSCSCIFSSGGWPSNIMVKSHL